MNRYELVNETEFQDLFEEKSFSIRKTRMKRVPHKSSYID